MSGAEIVDRLIFFSVGCAIGYVLHIIVTILTETKWDVDELLKLERKRNERGFLQHRVAFNIVFSLMMVFVFYSAFATYRNSERLTESQKESVASICRSGEAGRNVQRRTVDAIYYLAIGAIQEDRKKPWTKDEIVQVNRYIDRTNLFRETMYRQIHPTRACLEYVTDDHVKPPTPAKEHIN